jgi:hypothetical protein
MKEHSQKPGKRMVNIRYLQRQRGEIPPVNYVSLDECIQEAHI